MDGAPLHPRFVEPRLVEALQFYETIKEIEARLGDANVRLQSFIVSNTPSHVMRMLWNMEKPEMRRRPHILFQEEDKSSYVESMLDVVG